MGDLPFVNVLTHHRRIFYIIFECICPAFAELSCFADRELYGDWWNSTSWDEFSRKWNKPVHVFLLRHVYSSSRNAWNFSKWQAAFFTFFLSALAHELVMAVVSKKIRPYLFLMQISQIPLIAIGRLPIVRRNRTLGNIVFWLGLMIGFRECKRVQRVVLVTIRAKPRLGETPVTRPCSSSRLPPDLWLHG